jgi:hypothetical protein
MKGHNLNNVRRNPMRYFRNKQGISGKNGINELETQSRNKNTRDLYLRIVSRPTNSEIIA